MHALEGRADIDPRALKAILNLVNPFPDTEVVGVGWPDSRSVPSLPMVDTQEFSITAPAGLLAGQTWDAHVCSLPYAADSLGGIGGSGAIDRFGVISAPVAAQVIGPYSVLTALSGTPMNPVNPGAGVTTAASGSFYSVASGSQFRVVAQGIEVVNTSAALYRGGMAYAYRITGDHTEYSYDSRAAAATGTYTSMSSIPRPPNDPNSIVNYKNTYEGMAEDGLYIVNTPVDKPVESMAFGHHMSFVSQPGSLNSNIVWVQGCGPVTGWNVAGGFITGLAQGASLVVRFRTYIEIFPSWNDGNGFVRLANRTVPYSPIIDEIITRVLSEMPAGTAFTDNPLGEWFERLLEGVANFAPVVGDAVGMIFPPAKLIGRGIGIGAGAMAGINRKERSKNQNQQASSSSAQFEKAKGVIRDVAQPSPAASQRRAKKLPQTPSRK